MDESAAKGSYQRTLKDLITIRRYTGTGVSRTATDAMDCRCRITGFEPHELVGSVKQGDRRVILYADDVSDRGLTLPVTDTDKVVVRGREIAIIAVDDSTRRVNGVLIAYVLQVRG